MLSKPSQSDREEVSKMSKNKKNTLGANELESVAGGNKYLEELGKSDNFDLEWILSKSWDYGLLELMKETYGEDKGASLIDKYKTPEAMFGAEN